MQNKKIKAKFGKKTDFFIDSRKLFFGSCVEKNAVTVYIT